MEQREKIYDFLGSGIRFPVEADRISGKIRMSTGEENIREAVEVILRTRPGERLLHPEFGCRIYDYMFESPRRNMLGRMEKVVRDSLTRWEPRIRDVRVRAAADGESCVVMGISYRVRSTNNPHNLVFPFYLQEGFGAHS